MTAALRRPRFGAIGGAWSVHPATVPEALDVAAIRARDGRMTQAAFARRYGFSLAAVKDWEQGRKRPGRTARIVLATIDLEPAALRRVLGS